jgi:hypothetical protein
MLNTLEFDVVHDKNVIGANINEYQS